MCSTRLRERREATRARHASHHHVDNVDVDMISRGDSGVEVGHLTHQRRGRRMMHLPVRCVASAKESPGMAEKERIEPTHLCTRWP